MNDSGLHVYWSPRAKRSYRIAWRYIAQDSKKIANRVFDEFDDAIEALTANPLRYPIDRYRTNNAGDFRAFEIYNYRIANHVAKDHVLIVRFRHVKQKPRKY